MGKARYGAMPAKKGSTTGVAPDAVLPAKRPSDGGGRMSEEAAVAKSIYQKAVSTAGGGTNCGGDDAVRSR